MSILVLNDTHCGVRRVSGTTHTSQTNLRKYITTSLADCIGGSTCNKLVIDGDLLDDFSIEVADLMSVFNLFVANWLKKGKHLWLVAGNHDDSAKGNRMSHFEFLSRALQAAFPDLVHIVGVGGYRPGDGYEVLDNLVLVAHHCDQSAFDVTLRAIMPYCAEGNYVLLHANYDNNFAARSDHSLNVTQEVAEDMTRYGAKLVFSHEHQARTALGGKVIIMGNQWPSSIADCLNNTSKYGHVFEGTEMHRFETWSIHKDVGFILVDWKELDGFKEYQGFIRVTGTATAEEASSVVSTIARFRMKADALVVGNHVEVDGIAAVDDDADQVVFDGKSFDLMSFIKDYMTPEQFAMFCKLKDIGDAK